MFDILVIDDDPIIQMVLRKTLQEQGYAVTTASTGEEGIAKAHAHPPAMIICDWLMAEMNGLEVCHHVKADPVLCHSFFILLTARTAVEDRVKGLDTGADEFLPKPIDINELNARVRSGLRLYQTNQDLQRVAQTLQVQQQILEAELAEAARYVRSLLPPPLTEGVTIESRFLPSSQLGGDCFDYYWLDADHLVIYLLDMAGHGLGAALPSVSVQNLLRSQALPGANFSHPQEVLSALNTVFQMKNQGDRYFTIWYGVYNRHTHLLTYASAGHPAAILVTEKPEIQLQRLKTLGMPIGLFAEADYDSAQCTIPPESMLYVFSDGIYEIKQPDGTMGQIEHFLPILTRSHQNHPSDLDHLLNQVKTCHHLATFEDDCSILQVQFHEPTPPD